MVPFSNPSPPPPPHHHGAEPRALPLGAPDDPGAGPSHPGEPTLRVRGLGQLAALVPFQLGFVPHDSLVVVGLRSLRETADGTTVAVDGVARIDLPHEPAERAHVARTLAAALVPTQPDDVLVLVFHGRQAPLGCDAEDPHALLSPPQHVHETVADIAAALGDSGIGLLDALYVSDSRYRSLVCADAGCCPLSGHRLPRPSDVPAVVELVGCGAAPVDDRTLVCDSVAAGSDPMAPMVARALGPARSAQARRPVLPRTVLRRWRDVVLRPALLRAADPQQPAPVQDPGAVARIVAELEWDDAADGVRPPRCLRDAVVTWCDPDDEALGALPSDVAALAHDVLGPCLALDAAQRAAVVERLAALLRCVPAPDCAGVGGVLAAVAWRSGDVVRARSAAEQVLATDPGHRLAGLVLTALDHGVDGRSR